MLIGKNQQITIAGGRGIPNCAFSLYLCILAFLHILVFNADNDVQGPSCPGPERIPSGKCICVFVYFCISAFPHKFYSCCTTSRGSQRGSQIEELGPPSSVATVGGRQPSGDYNFPTSGTQPSPPPNGKCICQNGNCICQK